MRRIICSLYLLGLAALFGCSFLEKDVPKQAASNKASGETTEGLTQPKVLAQGIEVTWEVPSEPVDGFVIRYGYSANKLDQEYRVRVNELKEEKDSEFGPVYRHTIPNIERDQEIYVSLAAFKGDRLSDFSETIKEEARSSGL